MQPNIGNTNISSAPPLQNSTGLDFSKTMTLPGSGQAQAPTNWSSIINSTPSSFVSSSQPIISSNQKKTTAAATSSITGVGGNNGGGNATDRVNGVSQNPNVPNANGSAYGSQNQNQNQNNNQNNNQQTNQYGMPDYMQWYTNTIQTLGQSGMQNLSNVYNTHLQNSQLAGQQVQLQYDTNLGSLNTQYQQDYTQLQQQHQMAIGSAVTQAATLDPFGVNMSGADRAYTAKIDQMFTQQATFLTNAYHQQQVALENGQAEAALSIQQQINSATSDYQSGVYNLVSGMTQSLGQAMQFQQSKQVQYGSQFRSMLDSTDLTGYQSAIKGMSASDAMNAISGTPLGQLGQQAGYSPEQIVGMIQQGTINQAKLNLQAESVGIAATNAFTNQQRTAYQGITTAIASNKFSSEKSQQYSNYMNAVQGIANLRQKVSGSGGQDLLNVVNGFIHNPSSDASKVTAAIGQDGSAIISAIYGHTGEPTPNEIASFFGNSTQTGSTLTQRLNTAAAQLKTTIGNQITTDKNSNLIDPTALNTLSGQLDTLLPTGAASGGTSGGGTGGGFADYLNNQLGGKYNISIGQ